VNGQSTCHFIPFSGRLLYDDCPTDWPQIGEYSGLIKESFTFDKLSRQEENDASNSYFRNRWYDAKTGRFTQEDPIGFGGGSNLYAYAGNNPATYTDPFGLCTPMPACLQGLGALRVAFNDVRVAASHLAKRTRESLANAGRSFYVGASGQMGVTVVQGSLTGAGVVSGSLSLAATRPNVAASVDVGYRSQSDAPVTGASNFRIGRTGVSLLWGTSSEGVRLLGIEVSAGKSLVEEPRVGGEVEVIK
jgi:RHS repeat-associated protein